MTSAYNRSMLGEAIVEDLEKRGWTQGDLAKKLGVYQQTVSKWIRGETTPRPVVLGKLAELFGWDANAIYWTAYTSADEVQDSTGVPPTFDTENSPAEEPAFSKKLGRLSDRDRRVIERMVDEMLGEE